jgi:hypothetical protein
MLGMLFWHQGLNESTSAVEGPQYSLHAIYCGTKNPAPTLNPPIPVARSRRIVVIRNSYLSEMRALRASSSSSKPLRIPLLRNVVAMPNDMPDVMMNRSCQAAVWPFELKLFANKSTPQKVKRAQELSAYGAERKRPAGDTTCRSAAVRANPDGWLGKTVMPRAKTANTERRCATWAMSIPRRASSPS